MTIGDDWGRGADKETGARTVNAYAQAGGDFVDTANNYTDDSSERILAELLDRRHDRFVETDDRRPGHRRTVHDVL